MRAAAPGTSTPSIVCTVHTSRPGGLVAPWCSRHSVTHLQTHEPLGGKGLRRRASITGTRQGPAGPARWPRVSAPPGPKLPQRARGVGCAQSAKLWGSSGPWARLPNEGPEARGASSTASAFWIPEVSKASFGRVLSTPQCDGRHQGTPESSSVSTT